MPCSGREGSKVNSIVYKLPSCGHQQQPHGEKPSGGEHYMCTPHLVPNPKGKSPTEEEKDLAFSQEGIAMQGEAQ